MRIGEEARGVLLDHLDPEVLSRINAHDLNTGLKGSLDTPNADTTFIISHRVGEDDPWWAGGAARSLVNVCCG